MTGADITHADLAEHYQRTTLAALGITFERALASVPIRITLENAVHATRRHAARQADRQRLAMHLNQQQEAA